MKKLYLAEICKIKRMKMTYVAYIGILFSMIISSVQLLGRVQDCHAGAQDLCPRR